jgi:hypothetical protein
MSLRLMTSVALAPRDAQDIIDSYLPPQERGSFIMRRHPASFLGPFCLLAMAAAAAGLLTAGTLSVNLIAVGGAWVVCALLLLASLIAARAWYSTFLVITERRLLFIDRRGSGKVTTVLEARPSGLIFRRSLPGRLIGYGTFVVNRNGKAAAPRKARYLPYPDMLYLEICGLMFPYKENENEIDQTGRFYPGS